MLAAANILLIAAYIGMINNIPIYSSVHEMSSNQHCKALVAWMSSENKEPDSKAEGKEEQFLGKFLERKRSGRAKPYQSDEDILTEAGYPNLFDKGDSVKQQVIFAKEICEVLKANSGKIPSRTKGDPKHKKMGHWIRNRRAAAHGAINLNIPPEVVQVFQDAGLLFVLHLDPVKVLQSMNKGV